MIEGLISASTFEGQSVFLCSLFVEDKLQNAMVAPNLYQFLNPEQETGVIVGTNNGRFILIIFTNTGNYEFYQERAGLFLFNPSFTLETSCQNMFELMKKQDCLTSVVVGEGARLFYLSVLEECDASVVPLSGKEFQIRYV
jgi:hypothetical protein